MRDASSGRAGRCAYFLARTANASSQREQWAQIWLTVAQKRAFCIGLIGLLTVAVWLPGPLLCAAMAAATAIYALNVVFRAIVNIVGFLPAERVALVRADDDLPIYSVIAPLYKEANMATKIVAALSRLDYPHDRLDVLFAVEADDLLTIGALAATDLPDWARIIVVPKGKRCSKPRACNHALSYARGSFIVVFDAEDRPEAGQLRDAVAAFDAYGPSVVCLQARLIPYNREANFLTRMFTLDYCQWFDVSLNGLARLGFSIPLGGTSNHFRTTALVEAGAWDPHNVTEDADLGIRLGRLGMGVRTIDSTTFEEAPVLFSAWLTQRTRWIKGYMQTVFVHVRSARALGLGPLGYAGSGALFLFVAASVLFALINPIFWTMTAYDGLFGGGSLDWLFGPSIMPLARASFYLGNASAILTSVLVPIRRGWWGLMPWGFLTPIYWLLVSLAAYRALLKFIHDPFCWEKTPHGLALPVRRKLGAARFALVAVAAGSLFSSRAEAGAWPQQRGFGLVISTGGYVLADRSSSRALIEQYGEFGLGHDLTAVAMFDGNKENETGHSVWRAGGGLRYSFELDAAPDWHFSGEATFRFQRQQDMISDPTLAGDGPGGAFRVDAGRAFEAFGVHGFVNLAGSYAVRSRAPAEVKPEVVAGLDLDDHWQLGAGYFGSIAHGRFDDGGAYEKHEGQLYARWRFKPAYALEVSVSQTFAVDRIAQETTIRLALWSFLSPDPKKKR